MNTLKNVRSLSCLCAELKRASRAVTRLYDDAQRELGLSSGQLMLLFAMQEGPRSQMQLGETFSMDTTTLTRSLRLLAQKGYIETREGRADRRERWHELTAEGRKLVREGHARWLEVQQALFQRMGDRLDFDALRSQLHVIVAAAED